MEFRRSKSNSRLPSSHINPQNKYQIGQMLGQGQYGKVYKAYIKDTKIHNNTQKFKQYSNVYAIKMIPVGKIKKNPKLKQLLTNQIEILGALKHENIIQFEELFTWEDKIYMVYQYCQGGDLEQKLPLQPNRAFHVFYQIVRACSFAQKNNILHRDLKPANILFKNGEPKVADWGFSRYLKEEITATSFVGSPAYMAPELLKGSEYTNKADVWSYGVMLYECLFNQMPWSARNIKDLLQKVSKIPLTFPKQISPVFKSILKLCLEVDPEKRASFKKLQKIMQISKKTTKTEHQNPEQESLSSQTQLSTIDIRQCSYYLQFAKQSQKFQLSQAKTLCLELIINNLKKIRRQNFGNKSIVQEHSMTPCFSQRMMSLTKRQIRTPKTTSKLTKRQNREQPEACILLQKQIHLIQKIRQSFPKTKIQSPSKQSDQKCLIKQILKKLIKNISISQKTQTIKTSRKQLIQMNCILEIIMYEQLSQQVKSKRLINKIQQMQELNLSALVRSVNHKILYVNQKYCKL